MTTDWKAEYENLQRRYMTVQNEVETLRKSPNAAQIIQNMIANPIGTLKSAGYGDSHIDHLRNVFIADKLGPQAPMPLQIAANQGPMLAQFQELMGVVKSLADEVKTVKTTAVKGSETTKFESTASDASKYPNLAKAYAKNPTKFKTKWESHDGSAEDFLKAQESELKEIAEALGVTPAPGGNTAAASVNAEQKTQSEKGVVSSAASGLLKDVPVPQSPKSPDGKWGKDTFSGLKERLVAEAQKKTGPQV